MSFPQTQGNGMIGTKKRKPLPATCYQCRDCPRMIGWCKDVKDPKGPRCYDCAEKHRRNRK